MTRLLVRAFPAFLSACAWLSAGAAAAGEPPSRGASVEAVSTIESLIRDILTARLGATSAEGSVAGDLGLPAGSKAYSLTSPSSQGEDGRFRKALAFLDPGSGRPLCLVLFARKDDAHGKAVERVWLRISQDGRLEKARRVQGSIENPSRTELLDIRSKRAAELKDRELDFWLKAKGVKRRK